MLQFSAISKYLTKYLINIKIVIFFMNAISISILQRVTGVFSLLNNFKLQHKM